MTTEANDDQTAPDDASWRQLRDDLAWLRRQVLAVAEDLERYAADLRWEGLERRLAWTLRQIVAGERPETAPESPQTDDPAPARVEASTEHLGDADGAVAYWRAEISEILAAWLGEEQRTGWQRLASDVAEQILRDLDIADMAAERDRLRAEVKQLSARVREWEAVHADLATRCDSGDIPIRPGERYSLAVLREIDRLRDLLDEAAREIDERDKLLDIADKTELEMVDIPDDDDIIRTVARLRAALGTAPTTGDSDA